MVAGANVYLVKSNSVIHEPDAVPCSFLMFEEINSLQY